MRQDGRWLGYAFPALASLAAVAVLVPGCPPTPQGPNIVEVAEDTPSLSTLVIALDEADLTGVLSAIGPFTVFAPNNAAFAALPAGVLNDLLQDANQARLVEILLGHVVAGELLAADLQDGQTLTALNGNPLSVTVQNGVVRVDGARVVTADVQASNGVIHIIDAVILPNITETVLETPTLTTLATAVEAADLDDDLAGTGPFTVFAPNNAAFAALPAGTLVDLLLPANQAQLVEVLQGHVVAGEFLAGDLQDGQVLTDLNGNPLTVDITNGVVSVNGAEVIQANIVAGNGVIHIIDAVLLPPQAP